MLPYNRHDLCIVLRQIQKSDLNRQHQHYKCCVLPLNYSGSWVVLNFVLPNSIQKSKFLLVRGFPTQESSLAQIMYTFYVYKALSTTLTPTVGFEPTYLSAPLFSRQFAYNHLHTLAYSLIKPLVQSHCWLNLLLPGIFQNYRLLLLTVCGLISLKKFFCKVRQQV